MSLLNLWAFVIFIFYPCTPPRLLPEEFGFIDTVNRENAQSVWMSGQYVNKLAAMPSMHFGYAFAIGCVFVADSMVLHALFAWMPRVFKMAWTKVRRQAESEISAETETEVEMSGKVYSEEEELLLSRGKLARAFMFAFGLWYPAWILLTIVATANHYFLDAIVAGFGVLLSYWCNRVLLNLLPVEDMLLWVLRLEKPVPTTGFRKRIQLR
jgi:hypothetical protein